MKLRILAGIVLSVAVALTSCGADDGHEVVVSGAQALADAAGATAEATYIVGIESVVKVGGDDESEVRSNGHVARSGSMMSMSMEIPNTNGEVSMEFVAGDAARQFVRYVGMPDGSTLPSGWIELTEVPKGSEAAVMSSATVGSFLAAFQKVDAKVEDVGTTKRDGRTFRRFRTRIDLSPSVEFETENRVLGKVVHAMAKTVSDLDTDVEVDEDGHVVTIVYRTESAVGTTTTTMEFSGFGEPVKIETPTPDHTMTFDEFIGLVYPEPESSTEAIDESELIDRGDFIDAMNSESGLDEKFAACVYDELRESSPRALLEESYESGMNQELAQAMASAGLVCGAEGG